MSCTDVIRTQAPDIDQSPGTSEAAEMKIRALISQELAGIAAILETIGDELCSDPHVVRMHISALQSIDELCQRHHNLGRMLSAKDMESAVNDITLESLRVRMVAAIAENS